MTGLAMSMSKDSDPVLRTASAMSWASQTFASGNQNDVAHSMTLA